MYIYNFMRKSDGVVLTTVETAEVMSQEEIKSTLGLLAFENGEGNVGFKVASLIEYVESSVDFGGEDVKVTYQIHSDVLSKLQEISYNPDEDVSIDVKKLIVHLTVSIEDELEKGVEKGEAEVAYEIYEAGINNSAAFSFEMVQKSENEYICKVTT